MENTLENIGLKNVSIDFLNSEIKNLFVVQGDTRTRGLLVRIKDNKGNTIPLSDEYELRLYAKRSGEDKLLYSVAEKIGDRYKVYLTSDMLSKVGTLKIQLALYKGDVSLIQSRQSSVFIYPSMTCQSELGKDNVIDIVEIQETIKDLEKEFEKIKSLDGLEGLNEFKKNETERQQAEEQRKQSEEQRVVEETTRSLNEQTRIENEKQRIADEEIRKSNEDTRKANEQARIEKDTANDEKEQTRNSNEEARKLEEQKRVESENLRVSQEQERQNKEKERQEHETIRVETENNRNSQEEIRKANEEKRISNEEDRENKETTRVQAEQERVSNEQTRVDNEKTRQEQEQTRQRQEEERVKAEQQRSTKDTERDITFKNWDIKIKSLSGLPDEMPEIPKIEKATETVAGIVKLKGLTEQDDTAVSYSLYNKAITDISSNVDNKLNEKEQAFSGKIEEQNTTLSAHDKSIKLLETKADGLSSQVTGLSTSIDEKINKNNSSIDDKLKQQDTKVDTKLKEYDTSIQGLKDTTQSLTSKTDNLSKSNEELLEKVNSFSVAPATSEKLGIVKLDVDGTDTAVSTKTYTDKISTIEAGLNTKATKEEIEQINTSVEAKANQKDLETLSSKLKELPSQEKIDKLSNDLKEKANQSEINTLKTLIDSKAEKAHVHSIADVTGLQTTLDKKLEEKDINEKLILKADKKDVDELKGRYEAFEGNTTQSIFNLNEKIRTVPSQGDLGQIRETLDVNFSEMYKIVNKNSNSISDLSTNVDEKLKLKADKKDVEENNAKMGESFANAVNTALAQKANKIHTHTISDVDGLKDTLDNKADKADLDKIPDVAGLKNELDKKASTSDLANLQKKVDGKSDIGHTHSISAISNLQTTLDKKANTSHTHSISDVSNLQSTLNSKASTTHKHDIGDINNLEYTLDRKASTSHRHSISDISDLQYTLNNKASASDLSSLEAKINNLSNDSVRNKNGGSLSFWAGTQYQYDNIYYKDSDTIYFITE